MSTTPWRQAAVGGWVGGRCVCGGARVCVSGSWQVHELPPPPPAPRTHAPHPPTHAHAPAHLALQLHHRPRSERGCAPLLGQQVLGLVRLHGVLGGVGGWGGGRSRGARQQAGEGCCRSYSPTASLSPSPHPLPLPHTTYLIKHDKGGLPPILQPRHNLSQPAAGRHPANPGGRGGGAVCVFVTAGVRERGGELRGGRADIRLRPIHSSSRHSPPPPKHPTHPPT